MSWMRSTWTDSRLDDLNGRVHDVAQKVDEMDTRLTGRIDSLQQTILLVGGGLFAAFVGLLAAMLGLVVTLLVTQL